MLFTHLAIFTILLSEIHEAIFKIRVLRFGSVMLNLPNLKQFTSYCSMSENIFKKIQLFDSNREKIVSFIFFAEK